MSDEYRVHFGDDRYGFRRISDDYDEQEFFEKVLYSRRHDGLYVSQVERDEDDGEYDNE